MARHSSSKAKSGSASAVRARRKSPGHTRRPAASRAVPASTAAPTTPAAAAMLDAPASWVTAWTQFADQLQRAGQQTLQGLQHDAEVEGEALQHANSPQQLAGLPIGAVAEQATRWAQLSTQVAANWFDVQAAWFRDLEAAATQLMSPWLTRDGRINFGSAQDLVEPPESGGPAPLLWSAQRIWSESAKVWLHAMSHDVQAQAAPSR